MILTGITFMIFGLGTLYMIGHYPGIDPSLWYRVSHASNITLAFVGAVLFISGVLAWAYRWVRNRLAMRKWR